MAQRDNQMVVPTNSMATAGDSSILIIQDWSAWGVYMDAFIQENFGIVSTVINSSNIASTDFSPFDIVITVGSQSSSYYSAISSQVAKFEAFVANGGIVQYQLATQGDNVSIVNGVDVLYGNAEFYNTVLLPDHPIVAGLPTTLEGNFANHCYLANLPVDATVITETSISSVPTTVEYPFGNGLVIATGMTWEFLYNYGYTAGALLYNAVAYSLSRPGARWLSVDPISGTIPAGSSMDIAINFDAAGLSGGDYHADIVITSNDPITPESRIPVHLDVTGAADITVSADTLDFGRAFVNYPDTTQ